MTTTTYCGGLRPAAGPIRTTATTCRDSRTSDGACGVDIDRSTDLQIDRLKGIRSRVQPRLKAFQSVNLSICRSADENGPHEGSPRAARRVLPVDAEHQLAEAAARIVRVVRVLVDRPRREDRLARARRAGRGEVDVVHQVQHL